MITLIVWIICGLIAYIRYVSAASAIHYDLSRRHKNVLQIEGMVLGVFGCLGLLLALLCLGFKHYPIKFYVE